jgi:hypothetical protein
LGRAPADLAVWFNVRAFPPLAVIAGLDCLAGLVLWRKTAGGPPLVLTNSRLCLAGFAVTALIVAGRWWLARIERESPAVWLRTALMSLALLPMLALLSVANSRHSHLAVGVTSALAVVSGCAVLLWNSRSSACSAAAHTPAPRAESLSFPGTFAAVSCPTNAGRAAPNEVPRGALAIAHPTASATRVAPGTEPDHWTERAIDETGAVKLQGRVPAEFTAGQSVANVHISFRPAFARVPEFEFEVEGDPSVRPRTPAVYWYGARVELKRAGDTSRPARVVIRFQACACSNSSRAA